MKKIYVRIRGGLGNQMFEYAYAYVLSLMNPDSYIFMDIKELNNYYWPFGLNDFVLTNRSFTTSERLRYEKEIAVFRALQFFRRKIFGISQTKVSERNFKKGNIFCGFYCDLPSVDIPNQVFLYGYFQNADVLIKHRDKLYNVFSLKNVGNNIEKYIASIKQNSVSVSIRFANESETSENMNFVYKTKDYYINLVNKIIKYRGYEPQIVVSSNNIDKVIFEKWLGDFKDVVYIKDCTATEQIEIIKHCKDFIISNSTFSWWAAFLGTSKSNGIVLSPKIWFDGIDICKTKLLFPNLIIDDELIK